MASMGGGYLDSEPLIRKIKYGGFLNRQLIQICVGEGLSKIGVKLDLQNRICERLQEHARSNDVTRFNRLKEMIDDPNKIQQPGSGFVQYAPQPPLHSSPGSLGNPPATPHLGPLNNYGRGAINVNMNWRGGQRIEFKESPYYHIEEQLGEPVRCEVMTQHRHTVKLNLKIPEFPILRRVLTEPALRVMVFCAAEGQGRQDVAFPHQSELKVNGGEVKANLRGLKNKPGSTRPVDITDALRYTPLYHNTVEMTYALTNKKFFLLAYVVKAIPVETLVKQLEKGKRITEQAVLVDMARKAEDADIVATASVLSLKCPLSTVRIDLPCRSVTCRHNQCFDATSYLQLQEQGPTWLCPICNNSAPFATLAVDEYVKNILTKTSKDIDQVTVEPNGKWETHIKPKPSRQSNMSNNTDDSDDDLIEITKTGESFKISTPRMVNGLPQLNGSMRSVSREQSTASGTPITSSANGKRSAAAAFIDLTSSGDEDEEPLARAPKRQHTGSSTFATPSSVPAYRPSTVNGYQPPRPS